MTPFERLFDRIVVLSLPGSADRRAHVRDHFRHIGLRDYDFHDACGIDHPEVRDLFDRGLVATYPPCFRCGRVACGKPDCNNVLIPQQVAVFASYLNLWRRLAAGNQRVLVCEDDVLFHPWALRVLDDLAGQVEAGAIAFSGDAPALLRLGWALGAEHDGTQPFRVSREVRMANPCHAVTGAYARRLLQDFAGVRHTADVFQHQQAPVARTHALSVFPPVASELSWSTGRLESLVHPKDIYARRLDEAGKPHEAAAYRERIARHVTSVAHRAPPADQADEP